MTFGDLRLTWFSYKFQRHTLDSELKLPLSICQRGERNSGKNQILNILPLINMPSAIHGHFAVPPPRCWRARTSALYYSGCILVIKHGSILNCASALYGRLPSASAQFFSNLTPSSGKYSVEFASVRPLKPRSSQSLRRSIAQRSHGQGLASAALMMFHDDSKLFFLPDAPVGA